MAALNPEQRERYARHLLVPEIGVTGQTRLLDASVLVVGAGGLGSPAMTYLAAAGVGRIGIVDDDLVDASNLQRQIVHTTADVGRPKTDSAAERIAALNPGVDVVQHRERLTPDTVWGVLGGYDVVLDGTDNFPTRYLLSDACSLLGIPDVWAAVHRFDAAISVFWRDHGPCYRCVHPRPPAPGTVPSCAEAGVLGALPGVVGAMQAVEAVKILTGSGRPLTGRISAYDALDATWRTIDVARNPACPVCGDDPTIRTAADVAAAQPVVECAVPTASGTASGTTAEIEVAEFAAALDAGGFLLDVRSPAEAAAVSIEGSSLIPLDQLAERVDEIPADREILVYCAAGARSLRAVDTLAASGRAARSLAGGIHAWLAGGPTLPAQS